MIDWQADAKARGHEIEDALGGIDVRYPDGEIHTFPPGNTRAIDSFRPDEETGYWTATSIKSANTTCPTYQRPGQLYGCLAHAVSDMAEALHGFNGEDEPPVLFQGDPTTGAYVPLDAVERAVLQVVVPPEISADHWQQFSDIADLAATEGINLIVTPLDGDTGE